MLYTHATAELRGFATISGIPVYANNRARGIVPPEHPLCAGAHTNMKVAEASGIGGPDVLLVLGARFGMFTEPGLLGPGRIPPDDCRILQVDVNGAELGRIRPLELGVQADCGATLQALLDAGIGRSWPNWSAWATAVNRLQHWHRNAYEEAIRDSDDHRRIMLQMKSKLSFGSLNLYLKSYRPGSA